MNKKNNDLLYLIQVVLVILLVMFFVIGLFIVELSIVYKIILAIILFLFGLSGRRHNSKVITYLYYFSSFCVILKIVIGVINGG